MINVHIDPIARTQPAEASSGLCEQDIIYPWRWRVHDGFPWSSYAPFFLIINPGLMLHHPEPTLSRSMVTSREKLHELAHSM